MKNAYDDQSGIIDLLWSQFWDIMKFKIPATIHAIACKLYADEVQKNIAPAP